MISPENAEAAPKDGLVTPLDHAAALARLEELMLADPAPGSVGAGELELLAFLIEEYEKRTIQIPVATPDEAVCFRREQGAIRHDSPEQ